MRDTISRQGAIDELVRWDKISDYNDGERNMIACCIAMLSALPPAQPNLSEAYSKAVFTWLMGYQIRAAELKGRYTPYEVLSWVANDWRKEHERFD